MRYDHYRCQRVKITDSSSTCKLLERLGVGVGVGVAANGLPSHRPVHIVLYELDWRVKGGQMVSHALPERTQILRIRSSCIGPTDVFRSCAYGAEPNSLQIPFSPARETCNKLTSEIAPGL